MMCPLMPRIFRLPAVLSLLLAISCLGAEVKGETVLPFATVDMDLLARETKLGKQSAVRVGELKALVDRGFARRKADAEAMSESLKSAAKGSAAERKRAQTTSLVLAALKKESSSYVTRWLAELKKISKKERSKVALAAKAHIDAVAAEGGYVWVLDRSANSFSEIPVLIYSKRAMPDITSEVMRRMDAESSADGAE